jgi:hypothetical protein
MEAADHCLRGGRQLANQETDQETDTDEADADGDSRAKGSARSLPQDEGKDEDDHRKHDRGSKVDQVLND